MTALAPSKHTFEDWHRQPESSGSPMPSIATNERNATNHSNYPQFDDLDTTQLDINDDPIAGVIDQLWLHRGINKLVQYALDKMERAFAYNSVFFLKTVLDLQAVYLMLNAPPPSETILNRKHVVKIAEIMTSRLPRKDKDGSSLSKELQVRTLVSALYLMNQSEDHTLDSDSCARFLKQIAEKDYSNWLEQCDNARSGTATWSWLIRYACDLVRTSPGTAAIHQMESFGSQAVHYMLAIGLVVSSM